MKKGFTLIELLAVIVILAIIAVIAVPQILGVIEKTRKGAAESSALGYIDAVEKQMLINELATDKTKITSGVYDVPMASTYGVSVKGQAPTSGWLKIANNKVERYSFVIGKYVVSYDGTDKTTVKGDTANEKPSGSSEPVVVNGATKVDAQSGETHKGIVYLDPTNISAECNASNSVSTTEVKTGCMKWYIFNDSGDNYTMILDHNTTARIKWNDSNSNVAYESSNLKAVVDDLVTTSGWEVTPRLITADEVNTIVGGVSTWNASDSSTWFYFEGTGTKNQTKPTYDSSNRSSYDWLYNNLNKCKTDSTDHGCTIEDGNTYSGYGTAGEGQTWGYWTSTPVGTAGSGSYVWCVIRYGRLHYNNANFTYGGVRPVISVSKSLVS